jgi:hypothetical protein
VRSRRLRLAYKRLADVPHADRVEAAERLIRDDPGMSRAEQEALRSLAHHPGDRGARIIEDGES